MLTRSELKVENQSRVIPRPLSGPLRSDRKKPTLVQTLRAQRKREGEKFPSNVRIEPVLQRHVLAKVDPEIRKQFLEMLKEH
ncbi:hypothetical protein NM688_g68 [Phlebia brevispora]|uniref:Uncharacterized protein n=1 Tax=Phlebia brevispora TaxID=194682 RepID=A0ACC1TFQ6_9APHY|nr:hypothetical protein NM688_g68 [Phlebia brevispora]